MLYDFDLISIYEIKIFISSIFNQNKKLITELFEATINAIFLLIDIVVKE
jgi:hypothetical protein